MNVILWAIWVAYFLVVEGVALWRHRTQDTFSFEVWALERRIPIVRSLVAGFLLWLILHFFVGG